VKEGFGTERIDLMYNDFVIVGPSTDPAGIKGMKLATRLSGPFPGKVHLLSPRRPVRYSRGRDGAVGKGWNETFRRLVRDLRKRN